MNPSGQPVRDALRRHPGLIGAIATPRQGNKLGALPVLAFDNGCFGKNYVGDDPFMKWLAKMQPLASRVQFAVAPDVVGDHRATLKRSLPFLPRIRALGYPAAFVLQNGIRLRDVPWDDCDVVFIGGDDQFKTCPVVRDIVSEARARGKGSHCGRVNTWNRLLDVARMGCDSSDGTTIAWGPDKNLAIMLRWLRDNRVQQDVLW